MQESGGGTPTGAKQEPRRKRPPGTTYLQQYVAEPSDVPEPPAPTVDPTQALQDYYTEPKPLDPNSTAGALAQGYAMLAEQNGTAPSTPSPQAAPEALTTATQEQEAQTYRGRKVQQMSWDDYLGLSEKKQAAVDFNTLLVQARRKDMQSDYEPNDAQRETYDLAVERMFGDEGKSEMFAPEMVALLDDIGFERSDAKRFDDLDDFLGLSAALTPKDIRQIGVVSDASETEAGAALPTLQSAFRQQAVAGLAEGTQALQDSLTTGNQILENWRKVAASTRNETLSYYGGVANELASPDIRVGENESYFQIAFNTLADSTNDPKTLELVKKDLGDKGFERFLEYADTKSKYSQTLGVGLGGDPQIQYRTPEEFRQLLGLMESGEPSDPGK